MEHASEQPRRSAHPPNRSRPSDPLARPPDPTRSARSGAGGGAEPPPDTLSAMLASIASPMRVAVLASLAHGPRRASEVARLLNLETGEAEEHLGRFVRCGVVAGDGGKGYVLTEKVDVHESGQEVELLLRSDDGAQVTARLPLHTAAGRLLAKGLSGGSDAGGPGK